MPGIGDIVSAAQLVYSQVEKAKFNQEQARLFARDIRAVVDSITRAAQDKDFESEFKAPLEDLHEWLGEARDLVGKFSGGIGSKISNFLQAGGYKKRFAVLSEKLVKISGTFNLEVGIQSCQDSKEALSAQRTDMQQLHREIEGLKEGAQEEISALRRFIEDLLAKHEKQRVLGLQVEQKIGEGLVSGKPISQDVGSLRGVDQKDLAAILKDREQQREHVEKMGGLRVSQDVGKDAKLEGVDQRYHTVDFVSHQSASRAQDLPSSVASKEEKLKGLDFSIHNKGSKKIQLKFNSLAEKREAFRNLSTYFETKDVPKEQYTLKSKKISNLIVLKSKSSEVITTLKTALKGIQKSAMPQLIPMARPLKADEIVASMPEVKKAIEGRERAALVAHSAASSFASSHASSSQSSVSSAGAAALPKYQAS